MEKKKLSKFVSGYFKTKKESLSGNWNTAMGMDYTFLKIFYTVFISKRPVSSKKEIKENCFFAAGGQTTPPHRNVRLRMKVFF